MTTLRILDYPDPRLKKVAKPVTDFSDANVQRDLDDLLETMANTKHCGGLAATQVDIKDPYRMFVFYDADDSKSDAVYIINPEIVEMTGQVDEEEGCMSVYPQYIHAHVHRPAETTIKGFDREGKPVEMTRDGYLAKLFVHEVDHLNGMVYIDHLTPLKRKMIDKKIKKIRRLLDK